MRSIKQVRIVIHADGRCSLDALNFADASCKHATEQLLRALAGNVLHERDKPEARRAVASANRETEAAR